MALIRRRGRNWGVADQIEVKRGRGRIAERKGHWKAPYLRREIHGGGWDRYNLVLLLHDVLDPIFVELDKIFIGSHFTIFLQKYKFLLNLFQKYNVLLSKKK